MHYAGLTWDHPRGYNALAAAAAQLDAVRGLTLTWEKQSLEGFEAHPIADLCARYDLVVLDHPHVGEAVAAKCLRPLESLFEAEEIAALERETIGPCLSSYYYEGQHWALPLDAATQVMAYRADLIEGRPPLTWDAVVTLSQHVPVALSLAGPHAALTFQSIAAALGEPPAQRDPQRFISTDTGIAVLDLMQQLADRSPAHAWTLNPIGLLGQMAQARTVALCPLIYGYVNYATSPTRYLFPSPSGRGQGEGWQVEVTQEERLAASGQPSPARRGARPLPQGEVKVVSFANAPRRDLHGRPGSTLGGTGIGISMRCQPTPALLNHLRWLLSEDAQTQFIPTHDGQPSRRSAWHDTAVNAECNGFYERTAETLESAYVRPRYNGAIAFQTRCSQLIRDGLASHRSPRALLDDIQAAFAPSRKQGRTA